MRLWVVNDDASELVRLWAEALASVRIRHPDRNVVPTVTLDGSGNMLVMTVANAVDTTTDELHARNPLTISCVQLVYFPGTRLAQQWLACAWAGYQLHESLELVTLGDTDDRPLDPHAPPYPNAPCNRALRDCLPNVLTPEALECALAVIVGDAEAKRMTELA